MPSPFFPQCRKLGAGGPGSRAKSRCEAVRRPPPSGVRTADSPFRVRNEAVPPAAQLGAVRQQLVRAEMKFSLRCPGGHSGTQAATCGSPDSSASRSAAAARATRAPQCTIAAGVHVPNEMPRLWKTCVVEKRPRVCGAFQWSQPGSNRRPSGCQPDALPAELWPRSSNCSPIVAANSYSDAQWTPDLWLLRVGARRS